LAKFLTIAQGQHNIPLNEEAISLLSSDTHLEWVLLRSSQD